MAKVEISDNEQDIQNNILIGQNNQNIINALNQRECLAKNCIAKKVQEEKLNNIIIAKIRIENNKLEQRILNSYENIKREEPDDWDWDDMKGIENEDEIKNSDIFINDKKIDFNYYYKFPNGGIYTIKYKFNQLLTSTNFMFHCCSCLISLDLSNFNTEYVTNMEYMFSGCVSLLSLNLKNLNTQKVTNMRSLFYNCKLLIYNI